MKQSGYFSWTTRLGGYLLIPHELLHILGFWLVGKRCHYRWGNNYVTPVGPLTRRERLVGILFPFGVFSTIVFISGILSGLAYRQGLRDGSFAWFSFWTGLALIGGLYAGTTLIDLRNAYLLLLNKSWYSWTPLDFFFLPVVDWDEIRQKIASEDTHDTQG